MGIAPSIANINDCNIDNNIKETNLEGKMLRVISVNKYIIAVKHNRTIRKILCKGKGYKLKDEDEKEIAIAKLISLINMSYSLVTVDAFGIDENGLLLVEIRNNILDNSINRLLLLENYIEEDNEILFN